MKIVSAIAMLLFLSIPTGRAQELSVIEQLKTMAHSGDDTAAHQLALAYAVGDGVEKDRKASDYWYAVAASLRDRKTSDEASKRSKAADDASPATPSSSPYLCTEATSVRESSSGQSAFGPRINPGTSVLYLKHVTQQPASDVPAWKKVFNAVVAAPAKAKAFLSDHSDDLTDIATFAIEEYVTGSEPTEGTVSKAQASEAGRTLQRYGEQQQSK